LIHPYGLASSTLSAANSPSCAPISTWTIFSRVSFSSFLPLFSFLEVDLLIWITEEPTEMDVTGIENRFELSIQGIV
jgi:hypothetical protein